MMAGKDTALYILSILLFIFGYLIAFADKLTGGASIIFGFMLLIDRVLEERVQRNFFINYIGIPLLVIGYLLVLFGFGLLQYGYSKISVMDLYARLSYGNIFIDYADNAIQGGLLLELVGIIGYLIGYVLSCIRSFSKSKSSQ